ncbi:phage head-tail connector protein [Halalkalibacterium halodurans]|uniref:phage head-tail connector protein n=1 Tax=Halalkalibacterium halodurans TaxID=86665 RepID=UPI002E21E1DC|nr:phage head-tail connector protein [Halalkalibacterium halodurans]
MLDELKSRLRITWNEEDKELEKLIKRSESYLSELTGATFDLEKEEWPKELLLERCRYVYNNAADEFERNFADELKRLILLVALGKVGTKGHENVP